MRKIDITRAGAPGGRQGANAMANAAFQARVPILYELLAGAVGLVESEAADVTGRTYHLVQATGINGDTVQIEASLDGAVWTQVTEVGDVSTDSCIPFSGAFRLLRAKISAGGTGTVTVLLFSV